MCIIREQFVSVRMRTLDQQTSGCHVMLWCGGDVYSSHWLELSYLQSKAHFCDLWIISHFTYVLHLLMQVVAQKLNPKQGCNQSFMSCV